MDRLAAFPSTVALPARSRVIANYEDYLATILPVLSYIHNPNTNSSVYHGMIKSTEILYFGDYISKFYTDTEYVSCPATRDTNFSADIVEFNTPAHKKLVYTRTNHFKKCVEQYECKQLVKIPDRIYDNLKAQLSEYNLHEMTLDGATFYNVTKIQILEFLKEMRETMQYNNLNLIYYTLTKRAPPSINSKRDLLLQNFNIFLELYDNVVTKRKNFINARYLLFQILNNIEHPCRLIDFAIVSDSYKYLFVKLFQMLGWTLF